MFRPDVLTAFAMFTLSLSSNLKKTYKEYAPDFHSLSFDGEPVNQTEAIVLVSDANWKSISSYTYENVSNVNASEMNISNDNSATQDEDLIEAEVFGIRKMNDLFSTKQLELYSLGLFLRMDHPAQYVATFNKQSKEAKHLAAFAYAALEGSIMLLQKYPNIPIGTPLSHQSELRNKLNERCPRRGIPQCRSASLKYRTADGSCNNPRELWWGSALSTMARFLPAVYHDGIQEIRRSIHGPPLPSPREISNIIHEDRNIPSDTVSHMLMQWGQFVDHDITATAQSTGFNGVFPQCCLDKGVGFQAPELMHPDCLPIPVSRRDSYLGPLGVRCLEFVRSSPAPRENCHFGSREQLSQVTSYLDASMVYSSSAERSDSLRLFRNGLLQYGSLRSRKPFLPFGKSDSLCERGSVSTKCFRAGDGRLSEQPALISLHIVFLRLHNGVALKLAAINTHWSDEQLYQEARRIVGALIQLITYQEYLPIVLGNDISKIFDLQVDREGYYRGYNVTVNPTIVNSFSTAAYRFGHSLVQQSFIRVDQQHEPIFDNVTIHNEFNNRENLHTAGSVDRLLLGLVNQPCQRRDEFLTSELTNHLFQTPSFKFGMDLASINIQRGRDHGIPSYTDWRSTCGLKRITRWTDFEKVTSPSVARKFRKVYLSVKDVDLFSAGLAEKPVRGGLIGPTFACIIAQQFSNLRKGDRFWFENGNQENSFTSLQLQQIKSVTFAQILCHTMEQIQTIQPFVFLTPDALRNKRIQCDNNSFSQFNMDAWAESFPNDMNKPMTDKDLTHQMETSSSRHSRDENNRQHLNIHENRSHRRLQNLRPIETNINKYNKVSSKHLLAPITLIAVNNTVHTPTFYNRPIYGSAMHSHQQSIMLSDRPIALLASVEKSVTPHSFTHLGSNQRKPEYQKFLRKLSRVDMLNDISLSATTEVYMPHNAYDINNPNPPNYGFNVKPLNNVIPQNAFFDRFFHLISERNTYGVRGKSDYNPYSHAPAYETPHRTLNVSNDNK